MPVGSEKAAGTATVQGGITVIPFSGDYRRGFREARVDVARSFYAQHPDDHDFLFVFTTFEFDTGGALAFYNEVRNDVEGIGLPLFDFSETFGSAGRLQGFIDMAAISRYSLNSRSQEFPGALNTMAHELMHRWGVYARYRNGQGEQRDLLGQMGVHWSLLAGTEASIMYGARWDTAAPGRFRLGEARTRLAAWDLYFAGMASSEELPPLGLIRGSPLDPEGIPTVGLETTGMLDTVSIAQVIEAEGERRPAAADAQRHFSAAIVLLTRPGEAVDPGHLAQLERLRTAFESYFQAITRGRASIAIGRAEGTAVRPIAAPPTLLGSGIAPPAAPFDAAITWLKLQQRSNGSWADRDSSAMRDTSLAVAALSQADPDYTGLAAARGYLDARGARSTDEAVWRSLGRGLGDASDRNQWAATRPVAGIRIGWEPSIWDVALAARGHADVALFDAPQLSQLADYLVSNQRTDGAFSAQEVGPVNLRSTAWSARGLLSSQQPEHLSRGAQARQWLAARSRLLVSDFGVAEAAEVLLHASALGLSEVDRNLVASQLLARQGEAGDWQGSVATTASIALVLATQGSPNFVLSAPSLEPSEPRMGQPIVLRVRVANNGGQASAPGVLQWYRDGRPSQGGVEAGPAQRVPALLPGETATLVASLETRQLDGATLLVAVVDPQDLIGEVNEDDNFAELPLSIATPPQAADLALFAIDQQLSPDRITALGETVRLSGRVRNLGQAAVSGLRVELLRTQAGARTLLAEAVLDVPGEADAAVALSFMVADLGAHTLELVADPLDVVSEADEQNNRVLLELGFDHSVDLQLSEADVTLDPGQPALGDDVSIEARIRNVGTRDSGLTDVRLEGELAGVWQPLAAQPLEVPAGAQVSRVFAWRPGRPGLHRLRIRVDPDDRVAELDAENNQALIEVQVADAMNLIVEPASITLSPEPALEGGPLQIVAALRNQGRVDAPAFNVAAFLGDPREGGIRLGATRLDAGLPGDGAVTATIQVGEFPGYGNYSLFVLVDSELEVVERNESDNLGVRESVALTLPDLTLQAGAVRLEPSVPVPGLPVRIDVEVSNLGEQPSEAAWVRLEALSEQQRQVVPAEQRLAPLAPGQTFVLSWEWFLPEDVQFNALLVTVDPDNLIREHIEDNNQTTAALRTQDAMAYVSEYYFSPNGDGLRDRTSAWFADGAARIANIEVRDAAQRRIFELGAPSLQQGSYRGATWSGQDLRGGVAPDGIYRLIARDARGAELVGVEVILDINRPAALDAVHTDRAFERSLPQSAEPWQRAAEGTEGEEYLFARGSRANSSASRHRGILRTHVLMGGVEYALSPRWLDRHVQREGLTSAEVELLAVGGDRGRLVFVMSESSSGSASAYSLWVQDALSTDQPRRVASLPAEASSWQMIGFLQEEQVLIGRPGGGQSRWLVDLDTGASSPLREPDSGLLVLKVYRQGVVLGPVPNSFQVPVPTLFVPAASVSEPVALSNGWEDFEGERLCFFEASLHPEQPRLLVHRLGEDGLERIDLMNLETRELRTLSEAQQAGACQFDESDEKHAGWPRGSAKSIRLPGASVVLSQRAFWQPHQDRLWVVDQLAKAAIAYSLGGQALEERAMPDMRRVESYQARGDQAQVDVLAGDAAFCGSAGRNAAQGLAADPRTQFAYDVASERLYTVQSEAVQVGADDDAALTSCAGVAQHLELGPEADIKVASRHTHWPLAGDADRARYPLVESLAEGRYVPERWPRLIQRNGTQLQANARVRRTGAWTDRPWAEAARVLGQWETGSRIDLGDARDPARVGAVFSSLGRLSAVLRASSDGRSIRLSGVAVDENFESYRIDYAPADSPNNWRALIPATRDETFFDDFLTWAPPEPGAYVFRLSVSDRAGNTQRRYASAEAQFGSPIGRMKQDQRAISPNGDGVQDQIALSFMVTRPNEQRFRVIDSAARTVLEQTVVFGGSELGENTWIWDGRDQMGNVAPDGLYRIVLSSGFELRVAVDLTPPRITAASQRPTYPISRYGGTFGAMDYIGESPSPVASVTAMLERRALADTQWRPWRELPKPSLVPKPEATARWSLTDGEHFGHQYRLVLTDRAGNRAVQVFAPPIDVLALQNVAPNTLTPQPESIFPANWQAMPFDLDSANVPLLQFSALNGPFTPTVAPDAAVELSIVSSAAVLEGPVAMEYRLATSSQAAQEWRVLSETDPVWTAPHRFRLKADLEAFADGWIDLRVAFRAPNGTRTTSNAFRVRVGGASACVLASGEIRVDTQLIAPLAQPRITLRRPAGSLVLLPRRTQLSDTGNAVSYLFQLPYGLDVGSHGESNHLRFSVNHAGGRVYARDLPARGCSGSGGGGGAGGGTGGSGEGSPSGAFLNAAPVVAPSCDAPPTQMVEVVSSRIDPGSPYRLLLQDPRQESPVTLDSGVVGAEGRIEAQLSTRGLPVGEVTIRAEVEREGEFGLHAAVAFPVDRTPPFAQILEPAAGAKVCANSTGEVSLHADVFTDTLLEYRVDVATSAEAPGVEQRSSLFLGHPGVDCPGGNGQCQRQRDIRGASPVWNHEADPPRSGPDNYSESGVLARIQAEAYIQESIDLTARIRTMDWSGGQTCASRSFTVDRGVEFFDGDPAQPRIEGLSGPVRVAISTRTDAEFSRGTWSFRAGETLSVVASLFRGVSRNLSAHAGEPVLQLFDRSIEEGDVSFEWDARGLGLEDGPYHIEFVATDECGHVKALAHDLILDSTPPQVEISTPGEGDRLLAATLQIKGFVRDANFAQYVLSLADSEAGPWTELASDTRQLTAEAVIHQWLTRGLSGDFWLRLEARDLLGNQTRHLRRFHLLERPVVMDGARIRPLTFSPNGDGRLDRARIEIALRRPAQLRIDVVGADGAVVAILAGDSTQYAGQVQFEWDGLQSGLVVPEGEYQVRIRAEDAAVASIVDETELSVNLDITPPVFSAIEPHAGGHARCDSAVQFTIDDPHLQEYDATLHNEADDIVAGVGGRQPAEVLLRELEAMPAGGYTLQLRALDAAGNRTEQAQEFVLDCVAPEVDLLTPLDGAILPREEGRSTRIEGLARDENLVDWALLLAPAVQPTQRSALVRGDTEIDGLLLQWSPVVVDADYLLIHQARDRAGNQSELVRRLTLDGTPPLALITAPADGALLGGTLSLRGSANDVNFLSYEVALASTADAAAGRWSVVQIGEAPVDRGEMANLLLDHQGPLRLRLKVEDKAGWVSTAEIGVVLDTLPPPVPAALTARAEDRINVRLNWQGSEAEDLAGFHVYRDGEQMTDQPIAARTLLDLDVPEGLWTYEVVAVDQAGNRSAPSNPASSRIDRTPPEVSLIQPYDGSTLRGDVEIIGTVFSQDDFERYELLLVDQNGQSQQLGSGTDPVRQGVLHRWDTRTLLEGGRYTLRLIGEDAHGNRASDEASVVLDNLPPDPPQGLTVRLQDADVQVDWDPNVEPDLLGYLLYRNGALVTQQGDLPADLRPFALRDNSHLDVNPPDGELTYTVYAVDGAGNVSLPSAPVSVVRDAGPPHVEIVRPADGLAFDKAIEVLAQSEERDIASVAFAWRASGSVAFTPLGAPLTERPWRAPFDPEGLELGEYELTAVATDLGGRVDPTPDVVRVRLSDLTPPRPPAGVTARADGDLVRLQWQANAEGDLAGYRVERLTPDGVWLASDNGPLAGASREDAARPLGAHEYRVIAVDEHGNASEPSASAVARVFDVQLSAPLSPTAEVAFVLEGIGGARPGVALLQLQDASGLRELAPGDVPVAAPFRFIGLPVSPGQTEIALRVRDAYGHVSLPSRSSITRGQRPQAPATLQGLVDGQEVRLSWMPSDSSDTVAYRVYRDGELLTPDSPAAGWSAVSSARVVTELADGDPATAWTSQAGSLSDRLDALLEIRLTAPVLVGGVRFHWRDAASSARAFVLEGWFDERWNQVFEVEEHAGTDRLVYLADAYPTDRLRVRFTRTQAYGAEHALAGIEVLVRPEGSTPTFLDMPGQGRHRYEVAAISALGFEGTRSPAWQAEIGDAVAPDPVTLSGSLEGRDALLAWNTSDAADVARYRVYRAGQVIAETAADAPLGYRDVALPNGEHRYRVRVVDQVGNESAPSNEVVLVVQGDLPGQPRLLRVLAQEAEPALQIEWEAGSGAPVVAFHLFHSHHPEGAGDPFRLLVSQPQEQFLHRGLTYGERLYYKVRAEDAFGNLSPFSATMSGVVRNLDIATSPDLSWPTIPSQRGRLERPLFDLCGMASPGHAVAFNGNGIELLARAEAADRTDVQALGDDAQALDRILTPNGTALVTAFEHDGVFRLLDGSEQTVREPGMESGWTAMQFNLPGTRLYGISGGSIAGLDLETREWAGIWTGMYGLRQFAIDAAEQRALVLGAGPEGFGLYLHQRDSFQNLRIAFPDPATIGQIHWSSSGQHAWIASSGGALSRLSIADLRLEQVETGGVLRRFAVSLAEDAMAYVRDLGGGSEIVVRRGATESTLGSPAEPVMALAWSRDGRQLAVLGSTGVDIIEADSGSLLETVPLGALDSAYDWRLQFSPAGQLLVHVPESAEVVYLVRLAGRFCARGIEMFESPLAVSARAISPDGVSSLRSPPIEMDLAAPSGPLPDLAIVPSDIRFLPVTGEPGREFSAIVTARNRGESTAYAANARVLLIRPDGGSEQIGSRVALGQVDAGGVRGFMVRLGVLATPGDYQVQVDLDPDDQIEEGDERNNLAANRLRVAANDAAELRLGVDSGTAAPGGSFSGEVAVEGSSGFVGRLRLRVLDAEGRVVAGLGDDEVGPLTFAAPQSRRWRWTPESDVLAAEYSVEAQLFDRQGTLIDRRDAVLRIESDVRLTLHLQPARSAATRGERMPVQFGLDLVTANLAVLDGHLRLAAINPQGGETVLWEGGTGTLLAGYALRRTAVLATTGFREGDLRLRLQFEAEGIQQAVERHVVIHSPSENLAIEGEISVAPQPQIPLGLSAPEMSFEVRNVGATTSRVEARLRLYREGAADPLRDVARSEILSPSSRLSGELALSDLPQRTDAYVALLEGRIGEGAWQRLAQRGLAGVDVLPPQILSPVPGSERPLRLPVRVGAEIIDLHSQVARAQYRLDGGSWRALPAGGQRFEALVAALSDGGHLVSLRAEDIWGNALETADARFTVDNTPPRITFVGVTDGQRTRASFAPLVIIEDLHPDEQRITLNGGDFVPGETLSAESDYVLRVVAIDAAGNRADQQVQFAIDRSPPTVRFLEPAADSVFAGTQILVRLESEAGALVQLNLGAWQSEAITQPDGIATFDSVPLSPGENRLVAVANDAAGNLSAPVEVRVFQVANQGDLTGSILLGAPSVERGETASVTLTVRNGLAEVLDPLPLRLRWFDSSGLELDAWSEVVSLPVDASVRRTAMFPTTSWPLGAVLVELSAEFEGVWQGLATATLGVLDASPPTLAWLSPEPDSLQRPPIAPRVHATDDDRVSAVELSAAGGAWQAMLPAGAEQWALSLDLPDGSYPLRVRARDASGNLSVLGPIMIEVDATPPQIVVEGVADGGFFGQPVTPRITVLEPHPGSLSATLNGQPFASGSEIDRSGRYRLDVHAEDALGHVSQRTLQFELALEGPTITILEPLDGAVVASAAVPVRGQATSLARVQLESAMSSHSVDADEAGQWSVDSVALIEGENRLRAFAVDRLGRRSPDAEAGVRYDRALGSGLQATLDTSPAPLPVGTALRVDFRVDETAGQPRLALPTRLQIVRADDASVLDAWQSTLSLTASGQHAESRLFASAGWPLATLRADLEVEVDGGWVRLATATFAVVDRNPPAVSFVAPATGSYHRAAVALRLEASDGEGAVRQVEVQMAQGEWTALLPDAAPSGLWIGDHLPEQQGPVLFTARASDAAGNLSPTAQREVVFDSIAPLFRIEGVSEGQIASAPLSPTIRVEDASPVQTTITLNGESFASGSEVAVDGTYLLYVESVDAAGNRAERSLRFEVDRTPPSVRIALPVERALLRSATTEVIGETEPLARVRFAASGFRTEVMADAQGRFRVGGVPLQPGENLLTAQATDRAGNQGEKMERRVERRGAGGLRGGLVAPETAPENAPLRVEVRLDNDYDESLVVERVEVEAVLPGNRRVPLDQRSLQMDPRGAQSWSFYVPTVTWPQGNLTLRLTASLDGGVQLASRVVRIERGTVAPGPAPARPVPIPLAGPGTWLVFGLSLLISALAALRRRRTLHG